MSWHSSVKFSLLTRGAEETFTHRLLGGAGFLLRSSERIWPLGLCGSMEGPPSPIRVQCLSFKAREQGVSGGGALGQ